MLVYVYCEWGFIAGGGVEVTYHSFYGLKIDSKTSTINSFKQQDTFIQRLVTELVN